MPPATAPKRAFCSTCGFPARGSRCDACGAAQDGPPERAAGDDRPTKETQFRPYAPELDVDVAGLERAVDAWRNKDTARFVEHLVVAEGAGTTRTAPTPEGPSWIATIRGTAIFVSLRPAADEVIVEAPVARLPSRQRLPALRLALELCARDAASSRVCLRGDLLLLRFTARASMLSPAALRHYLREIGHLAARYTGLFVVGLDAHPALGDDLRAAGFEQLGRPRKVQIGGGARRSIPPVDRVERSYAGAPSAPGRPAPPRVPRHEELEAPVADVIPAVLSPQFTAKPPSTPPVPAMPPPPAMPTFDERRPRPAAAPPEPPRKPAPPAPRAPEPAPRALEPEPDAQRRPETSPSVQLSASDRLCMLLRHAQSLASLTLEERPASLSWLIRSTVFRAIYDFRDSVPDAVAHLYRCTGLGKEGASAAEPPLTVMDRVIGARGNMPKEKALALEPMVSASQAKEHVARYLSEIDRGPADQGVRHFLALGALTELLVRTKLPPQTDQRLRDIVAHAQREGAKQTAIDLMMTALQRINS